jgi:hypothetical protein
MLAIATMRFKEYTDFSVDYDYIRDEGLVERRTFGLQEAKAVWPDLKERALRVYNTEEFPPEPGEHCTWCPFRTECQPNTQIEMDELDSLFG